MWTALALVALAGAAAAHAAGYCSSNTFPGNTPGMQLTKEPIPFEYGFEDKHKSIHCCAKGYRSIEWFKDGVAYPWPAGVSNLIQYPEAANQTLYTQRAARSDSGNYTCRVSNETHSHQHTIHLEVLEKPPDSPKTMFISPDQWVEEGGVARLYCEALVGRSYLADAVRNLRWMKVWPNATDTLEGELLPSEREIKTIREHLEDIIGAYLVIDRVTPPDYGKYVCVVNSNEVVAKSYVTIHYKADSDSSLYTFTIYEHATPWRALLLGGACACVLAATALVLHRRCTPRLLLAARIAHARANATAQRARVLEKEFDVLVCWTPIDTGLVRGALLPTLTHKYKYRVHAVQLEASPDSWYNRLAGEAGRCRALLCVVSPTQHSAAQLLTALRQLHALAPQPVVVLLQDLPKLKREAKDANGDCLVSLLRRTRLLAWRHVHERAFWTALRLALPLPPHHTTEKQVPQDSEVKVDQDDKNSRSSSLTALV